MSHGYTYLTLIDGAKTNKKRTTSAVATMVCSYTQATSTKVA